VIEFPFSFEVRTRSLPFPLLLSLSSPKRCCYYLSPFSSPRKEWTHIEDNGEGDPPPFPWTAGWKFCLFFFSCGVFPLFFSEEDFSNQSFLSCVLSMRSFSLRVIDDLFFLVNGGSGPCLVGAGVPSLLFFSPEKKVSSSPPSFLLRGPESRPLFSLSISDRTMHPSAASGLFTGWFGGGPPPPSFCQGGEISIFALAVFESFPPLPLSPKSPFFVSRRIRSIPFPGKEQSRQGREGFYFSSRAGEVLSPLPPFFFPLLGKG